MYPGAGQTLFLKVVLTLQPFGSAWLWARSGLELEPQFSTGSEGPQAGATPAVGSCSCCSQEWGFSCLPCSSSTGIPSGPGKWGGRFTTLILQGTLKPPWEGSWVFKGTTNLQVHSTLPQSGIYNPACPERQFGLQKYSVVLTVRYKSQCCNECPGGLQGVFTGLEQE